MSEVTLNILNFDAAGMYFCEVSTDTPIFTKESNEEQIHVFRKYFPFFMQDKAIMRFARCEGLSENFLFHCNNFSMTIKVMKRYLTGDFILEEDITIKSN